MNGPSPQQLVARCSVPVTSSSSAVKELAEDVFVYLVLRVLLVASKAEKLEKFLAEGLRWLLL